MTDLNIHILVVPREVIRAVLLHLLEAEKWAVRQGHAVHLGSYIKCLEACLSASTGKMVELRGTLAWMNDLAEAAGNRHLERELGRQLCVEV